MAKLLKLRRGTTSQHSSFTGAEGEVTVDTDKDVLVVHDGSTAGGHPVAAQDMDNVPAGSILGTQLENSGVTAGQYGSSSAIPIVTVDAQGLVTAASTTAIDSTTIANGTSNVAVANNGNITTTRSGTARLVVDDAGVDVTGNLTATGNITGGNVLTLSGIAPNIVFTETNGDPDFKIQGNSGKLRFHDSTNNVERMTINADGHIDIAGNLDVANGVDVTGALTTTGNITAGGNVDISQGNLLRFGGTDAFIQQASTYMQIKETLSDNLYIDSNYIYLRDTSANIKLQTTSGGISVTGNIGVSGNVDGRDVGADGSKLDGIEANATQDQSANEILTAIKTVDGSGSGLSADLVDGLHASSFLRSDTADTASGDITFSGGAGAVTIAASSDIRMGNGNWTGEAVGKIQYHSNKHYFQATSGWQFRDSSGNATVELSDSGSITGKALTFNSDITFSGGVGALNLSGGSDIRFANGDWTGNAAGKIQMHSNNLYITAGSSGLVFRSDGGSDRAKFDSNGHFIPSANNTYNLGASGNRWANIYTQDLQLSNEAVGDNGIDGTWGNYTIVEGESDLFLKNNRSGKIYKFNLTEVS